MKKVKILMIAVAILVSVAFVDNTRATSISEPAVQVVPTTKRISRRTYRKGRWVTIVTYRNGRRITKRVWRKGNSIGRRTARKTKDFVMGPKTNRP